MLEGFGMGDCKSVATPLESNRYKIGKTLEATFRENSKGQKKFLTETSWARVLCQISDLLSVTLDNSHRKKHWATPKNPQLSQENASMHSIQKYRQIRPKIL